MPTPVSELHALMFENLVLKLQAAQIQIQQIQLNGQRLMQDRDRLLAEMRASVGADKDASYDPQTRLFSNGVKPPLSATPKQQAKRITRGLSR